MSLIDNLEKSLENELLNNELEFEDGEEEEKAFALECALESDVLRHDNSDELLSSVDLTDDEMEELAREVAEDLKKIDPDYEEDPELDEDDDDMSLESLLRGLESMSTDSFDFESDPDQDVDDIDDGINTINELLDDEIDEILEAGLDIDDLDLD